MYNSRRSSQRRKNIRVCVCVWERECVFLPKILSKPRLDYFFKYFFFYVSLNPTHPVYQEGQYRLGRFHRRAAARRGFIFQQYIRKQGNVKQRKSKYIMLNWKLYFSLHHVVWWERSAKVCISLSICMETTENWQRIIFKYGYTRWWWWGVQTFELIFLLLLLIYCY